MKPMPLKPMRARASERGIALIIALLAAVVLSGLGLGLMTLTNTEATIASNYRAGNQTLYAADAAAERVLSDLLTTPNWNAILSGLSQSGFQDNTLTPILPSRRPVSLTALTMELQAASDASATFGPNTPRWTLFAHGPLSSLAPATMTNSDEYAVVWISDDPGETDGDPSADSNGVVTVLAQAIGQQGISRSVEVTAAKTTLGDHNDVNNGVGQASVRLLSWREIR
jgi:PilX N-terminal